MASIYQTRHRASKQVSFESRFGRAFEAQLEVHQDGLALQELKNGSYAPIERLSEQSTHGSGTNTASDSEVEEVGTRSPRQMLLASKKTRKNHIVASTDRFKVLHGG